jgi:hypothetical protein
VHAAAAAAGGGKVPRVLEAIDVMVQLEGTGDTLRYVICYLLLLTEQVSQVGQGAACAGGD